MPFDHHDADYYRFAAEDFAKKHKRKLGCGCLVLVLIVIVLIAASIAVPLLMPQNQIEYDDMKAPNIVYAD